MLLGPLAVLCCAIVAQLITHQQMMPLSPVVETYSCETDGYVCLRPNEARLSLLNAREYAAPVDSETPTFEYVNEGSLKAQYIAAGIYSAHGCGLC